MAVEREDTESPRGKSGTEPGLGRDDARGDSRGYAKKPAPPADTVEEPAIVDFDALHAALGDPLEYQEMPSPAHEKGVTGESDELLDGLEANLAAGRAAKAQLSSESSGQLSATYASARPRTIPPTRAPNEDLNAPAVIVASDDTVPSAPPQMTTPLAQRQGSGADSGAGPGARPGPPSAPRMGQASAAGHAGPPSVPPSAPGGRGAGPASHANGPGAASYGQTPLPFAAAGRGAVQMTARMPDRPINPRRGKTPTIVVWPRGPSTKQKLVAFMAMLLLVTACGIAVIIWRQPSWLGLDALASPPATTSALAAPLGTPVAPPSTAVAPAVEPAAMPSPQPSPTASGVTSAAPASSAESRSAPPAHALPAPTGTPPPVRKAAKPPAARAPAVRAPAPRAPAPRAPAPRAPAPRRADPNTL